MTSGPPTDTDHGPTVTWSRNDPLGIATRPAVELPMNDCNEPT
jgi:hypothetical protein